MHKYSKEDIDLGGVIRRVLKLNPNVSELSLGYNFKDYLYELGFVDIRSVTKKLLSPMGINEILHLFSWATKQGFVNVITDAIPVIFGSASCTIRLISNVSNPDSQQPKLPFYIEDAIGYFKSFIVIDRLVSFKAGDGKTLLQIVKSIDIPCIIQVGYLLSGDYDYSKETNDWSYLDNLVLKYEQYDFINVNSIIGCYEDSVIMAYAKGLKSVEDYKKVINNGERCDSSVEPEKCTTNLSSF
ncbi:hypothetical protein [Acetivibrio ethanolgignens]|uniref:Uncharacterized protein n=1 Tax=Acetivibrio ethanolgignens TaxID=290052 RepID=A0A0V8QF85_9FIRM|nr:hypothetical protein [Acetivibrio ethanolgignens]KSV59132.1 hypothetical protein ASU35_10250 [Acetivibrio ethanolgignens]